MGTKPRSKKPKMIECRSSNCTNTFEIKGSIKYCSTECRLQNLEKIKLEKEAERQKKKKSHGGIKPWMLVRGNISSYRVGTAMEGSMTY